MANSAMLLGIGQGLSNVPQQLADLSFQQQSRQQGLQAGSILNQQAALQLQQEQLAAQNQRDYQSAMVAAWQGGQSNQPAAPTYGNAQAPTAPQGNQPAQQNSYGNLPVLQSAGITLSQLDTLAKENGVPPEIAYGVIASESRGNPNAVSPKGAVGSFQVMPSTAAQPGYGVAPLDPKSPQGAMSYMGAMWKQAGGDPTRFAQIWNAGKGGNPQNPETQGFTKNVLQNAQSFKLASTAGQAAQQPSPADQMVAREASGIPTPPTAYQQASQAQDQQIKMLMSGYNQAMQNGKPAVAQMFLTQAKTLQDQQMELQTKGLAVQKAANAETSTLAAGVKDQASYNNFQQQSQQNPAMQQAVAGLNLTGDYNLDRNKIQTLADRSETLKDQQDVAIKQQELQLKQQAARITQQKADQPKIIAAQAQTADVARQKSVAAKGIPFAPSIAATAPIGTTPQQLQQAQKQVATQNAAYDKANAQAAQGAKAVRDEASQAYMMLVPSDKGGGGISTGGPVNTAFDAMAPWALDAKQQQFNKLTSQMVQSMQLLAGANGGGRSASTAAMYRNFAMAKPNIRLSESANREIAHGLYVGAVAQSQMNSFLDEYRQSNPDATVQSGVLAWRGYEQALGPTMVYDASQKALVPNVAGIPTMEDGTPNPEYKDYHVYFANGGHW